VKKIFDKKQFWVQLKHKYRLMIVDDQTYEERISLRLSLLNLFIVMSSLTVLLVTLTVLLVVFTPLKEYIPGYGEGGARQQVVELVERADSLQEMVDAHNHYIENLNKILNDKVSTELPDAPSKTDVKNFDTIRLGSKSEAEMELRKQVETQDKFSVSKGARDVKHVGSINDFYFFCPVKGTITNLFNPVANHFGIDVVCAKDEAIKAVLAGKVIFADWTLETGYTISIQHGSNLISTYKHCSILFKKVGNFVTAGEVIGVVGNTGELTNGPHLHLELWYNGIAVNPKAFINFN
jgi:murein DD-endopeptidase MepM/ murein hydrolase activator NlpD